MQANEPDKIKVFSTNKCAYLLTLNVKSTGSGRVNDMAYLEFEMNQETQELLRDYYSDSLLNRFISNYRITRQAMKEAI